MKILILAVFIFSFNGAYAKKTIKKVLPSKTKTRKIANVELKNPYNILLSYEGVSSPNFSNVKLGFTPYTQFLTFKSFGGETYLMDCNVNDTFDGWNCSLQCEGGHIKIDFVDGKGFREITLAPFEITPMHCDGSEVGDEPKIKSSKKLTLRLKN